jgi:hypothetical protein
MTSRVSQAKPRPKQAYPRERHAAQGGLSSSAVRPDVNGKCRQRNGDAASVVFVDLLRNSLPNRRS